MFNLYNNPNCFSFTVLSVLLAEILFIQAPVFARGFVRSSSDSSHFRETSTAARRKYLHLPVKSGPWDS